MNLTRRTRCEFSNVSQPSIIPDLTCLDYDTLETKVQVSGGDKEKASFEIELPAHDIDDRSFKVDAIMKALNYRMVRESFDPKIFKPSLETHSPGFYDGRCSVKEYLRGLNLTFECKIREVPEQH